MPATPSIYRQRVRSAVDEKDHDKAVRALREAKMAEQGRIENAIYTLVESGVISREQFDLVIEQIYKQ